MSDDTQTTDEDYSGPSLVFEHIELDGPTVDLRQNVAFGIGGPRLLIESGEEGMSVKASIASEGEDPITRTLAVLGYVISLLSQNVPDDGTVTTKAEEFLEAVANLFPDDDSEEEA